MITKQDKLEFQLFCRNATYGQLFNIYKKEKAAKRKIYAEIAYNEIHKRYCDDMEEMFKE